MSDSNRYGKRRTRASRNAAPRLTKTLLTPTRPLLVAEQSAGKKMIGPGATGVVGDDDHENPVGGRCCHTILNPWRVVIIKRDGKILPWSIVAHPFSPPPHSGLSSRAKPPRPSTFALQLKSATKSTRPLIQMERELQTATHGLNMNTSLFRRPCLRFPERNENRSRTRTRVAVHTSVAAGSWHNLKVPQPCRQKVVMLLNGSLVSISLCAPKGSEARVQNNHYRTTIGNVGVPPEEDIPSPPHAHPSAGIP